MRRFTDVAAELSHDAVLLVNWLCQQSARRLVLIDLRTERIVGGNLVAKSSSPELPTTATELLKPEVWREFRETGMLEHPSPFQGDFEPIAASSEPWRLVTISPEEWGALIEWRPYGNGVEAIWEADSLTGLAPRGALAGLLDDAYRRFQSTGRPFAVLFLDLDRFKEVNDRWGHLAGDEVLRSVGAGILHAIRPGDGAVRFGGDEFVVIVGGLHSKEEAHNIAKRVRDAATQEVSWRGNVLRFTASVGVAYAREGDASGEMLLERADQAMYRAKKRGRDGQIEVD